MYRSSGQDFFPQEQPNCNELPPGTYTIAQTPDGRDYFAKVDDFTAPKKLYGNIDKDVNRIFSTFENREVSTGILLSGTKGSGKSLTAKLCAIRAQEKGMPTILINAPRRGEPFNRLIQSMRQPAVILFDEFEKVYSRENGEQKLLLTLLDGVFPTKKLFLFTCNDPYAIDRHMMDRPGRIFYHRKYSGQSREFIREYAQENLKNKEHIESLVVISSVFREFNFDLLKAIVEEMNRYNESPTEVLDWINASPDSTRDDFDVVLRIDKEQIDIDDTQISITPMSTKDIYIDETNTEGDFVRHEFSINDITYMDLSLGRVTYTRENKLLELTRTDNTPSKFSYERIRTLGAF